MKTYPSGTKGIIITMILCFTGANVFAQPSGEMERFRDEKIAFFNDKLDLSEKEAQAFWPVQEDLHNRKMKINEEEKTLLNYYNSNYEAMSDQEVDETIAKFMALQKKRVDLSTEYHDKFVKIIGKRKTMRLYALDREFRLHILQQFRSGRGGEGKGGPGKGPYRGNR